MQQSLTLYLVGKVVRLAAVGEQLDQLHVVQKLCLALVEGVWARHDRDQMLEKNFVVVDGLKHKKINN